MNRWREHGTVNDVCGIRLTCMVLVVFGQLGCERGGLQQPEAMQRPAGAEHVRAATGQPTTQAHCNAGDQRACANLGLLYERARAR